MPLLLFLLLLCAPCVLNANIELVHEQSSRQTYHYFLSMAGAFAHVSGHPQRAAQTYQQLSTLAPESESLKHAIIRLAFERSDYAAALKQALHVDANNLAHKEAAVTIAQSYLFSNRTREALAMLDILRAKYPRDHRLDYYAALAYIKSADMKKAHALVDGVLGQESRENNHFLFHFLKAKLLFLGNDLAGATTHINRALALNAHFVKGIVLKGVIAEKGKKLEEALRTYEHYITLTRDPEISKKVIALCFTLKKFARAKQLLLSQPNETADHYHDIALVCFKMNDYANTMLYADKALEKFKDHTRAQDLKIDVFFAEKRSDQAAKMFRGWLEKQPTNASLIRRWYLLANKGMPVGILIGTLQIIGRNHPTFPLCFALGDLLHEQQRYDEARTWYEKALQTPICKPMNLHTSKIQFQIARTWYQEKNVTKASGALQKALACTPTYPSAHNLAALIMIESGGPRIKSGVTSTNAAARKHVDAALLAAPNHKPYLATKAQLLSSRT